MLDAKGYEVTNYGTDTEESVDYPDFAILWLQM
jgi:ribose 5-phosphate isomerase B